MPLQARSPRLQGRAGQRRSAGVGAARRRRLWARALLLLRASADAAGPLRVVPGSHRWEDGPPNAHGPHVVGSEIALTAAGRLAAAHGRDSAITRLLDEHTIYLIPRANPDAAEAFFRTPLAERRGIVVMIDDARRVRGVCTTGDFTRLVEHRADFLDASLGDVARPVEEEPVCAEPGLGRARLDAGEVDAADGGHGSIALAEALGDVAHVERQGGHVAPPLRKTTAGSSPAIWRMGRMAASAAMTAQ